jgi:hypothetical protein
MDTWSAELLGPLAAGAMGLLLTLPLAVMLMVRESLNTEAFAVQVIKLVEAGNIDRAGKLCAVAPGVFAVSGVAAVVGAWQQGERSRSGLQAAYERVTAPRRKGMQTYRWASVGGMLLGAAALGGTALVVTSSGMLPPQWAWGLGLVPIVVGVFNIRKSAQIPARSDRAFASILRALSKQEGFQEQGEAKAAWSWG